MGRGISAPEDFSPDERDIWMVAQRQLRQQGTWTRTDVHLLEAYCSNIVRARRARAEAAQFEGFRGQMEMMMHKSALKVASDSEAAALRIATALLLTAESRKRHGIKAGKAEANELDSLIG